MLNRSVRCQPVLWGAFFCRSSLVPSHCTNGAQWLWRWAVGERAVEGRYRQHGGSARIGGG